VENLRLETATRLLKTTREPIKRIAETAGFGREERMRRAFQKHLGISPHGYRTEMKAAATGAVQPLGIALAGLAQ
jgi:transcriptional regulator GlxA family with amidase domain